MTTDRERGEIARKLQERNRHIDIVTARYYVDAVFDIAALAQPVAAAGDGSYVADDDTYPEMVMFADGRTVAISHDSAEPYLVVSWKRDQDMTGVLNAIGKAKSEAWASIEAAYQNAKRERATQLDDTRELLIRFYRWFREFNGERGNVHEIDETVDAFLAAEAARGK